MRRLAVLTLGLLAAAADSGTATARDEPGSKKEIADALCADDARLGPWNTAWTVTFSVAAVATAAAATFAPHDWFSNNTRAGLYVTSVKATIGALDRLALPLELDVGPLCDEGRAPGPRARRALLEEAATGERRTLVTTIVGGIALNTAGLLYLGFGRGSWKSAWISFGVGSAVSVLTTVTAPTRAWSLERRLDSAPHVAVVPLLGVGSAGAALAASW